MKTPRVAFLLPGLGRVQRGAETAFLEVARGLASLGVEVELFGSGTHGTDGLTAHVVPCRPRECFEGWPRLPGLRTETYYEELSFAANLLRAGSYCPGRFDAAVHCTYPYLNWLVRLTGRRRGPKAVFVTQNGDWPCRRTNAEFGWFGADGVVCINPDYHARHRGRYRAALIPNGVDPSVYRPRQPGDAAEFDVPQGRPVILIVSAFIRSKRVADGVRAVARVPDAFLLIAGDGPERGSIARLCQELLPGRHRLLGSISRERMPSLYRQADVFLHPSQEEPFGIVYLEAASSGLAVVAHDGAVQRWVLGDAGHYADTSDIAAVARALQQCLADETSDLRERARRRVLNGWSWDRQARLYRDFLLELR